MDALQRLTQIDARHDARGASGGEETARLDGGAVGKTQARQCLVEAHLAAGQRDHRLQKKLDGAFSPPGAPGVGRISPRRGVVISASCMATDSASSCMRVFNSRTSRPSVSLLALAPPVGTISSAATRWPSLPTSRAISAEARAKFS